MKDAFFFPHTSGARYDPKIVQMLSIYGMTGYGWFWVLLELLREQDGYALDISGKYAINALAMQMYTDNETAKKFINDCINEFHLFESDGACFWSNSLRKRMEYLDEKRKKARDAANIRWKNESDDTTNDTDAMQTQCDCNAKKEEESKLKKIKEEEETVSDMPATHTNGKNDVPDTKSNAPPYDEIVRAYNNICQTLPKVKVLSDGRRNQIRLRWIKFGKKYGIAFFTELFERANDSSFLSGASGKWNGCNFDWLLKEANMIKVMEGNYDN